MSLQSWVSASACLCRGYLYLVVRVFVLSVKGLGVIS